MAVWEYLLKWAGQAHRKESPPAAALRSACWSGWGWASAPAQSRSRSPLPGCPHDRRPAIPTAQPRSPHCRPNSTLPGIRSRSPPLPHPAQAPRRPARKAHPPHSPVPPASPHTMGRPPSPHTHAEGGQVQPVLCRSTARLTSTPQAQDPSLLDRQRSFPNPRVSQ